METRVIVEAWEVGLRLRTLGLEESTLREALRIAGSEAALCTEYDPPGNRGHVRWATAVRVLRLLLTPQGWTVNNNASGGLATVVHPSRRFQIAVVTGDCNTGRPDAMPMTKHPRGSASIKAVDDNAQGDLFAAARVPVMSVQPVEHQATLTLFLLVYEAGNLLHAELSRPTVIGDHGRATDFVDRILLTPVEVDVPPPAKRFDESDDIDFDVKKRNG